MPEGLCCGLPGSAEFRQPDSSSHRGSESTGQALTSFARSCCNFLLCRIADRRLPAYMQNVSIAPQKTIPDYRVPMTFQPKNILLKTIEAAGIKDLQAH